MLGSLLSAVSLEPKSLRVWPGFGSQAAEHVMDGGEIHDRFCRLRAVFVVLAQGSIASLPGKRSFHHPAHRQWYEPPFAFGPAHHFHPVGSVMNTQPTVQSGAVVSTVSEDHLQTREVSTTHLRKETLGRL